jgi:hemerythrin
MQNDEVEETTMSATDSVFRWTEAYSVNIARLDKQHQKLFETMSQIDEALRSGEPETRIDQILDSLISNTFAHFSTEECLMEKHGFPGLAEHQAEHAAFREEIAGFVIDRKNRPGVSVDTLFYTQSWLKQHLLHVDNKYVAYLNERGVR